MQTFADALEAHIDAMRQLAPTAIPLWGIMSAQHMVEHIAETLRLTRTGFLDIAPRTSVRYRLQYAFFAAYLRTGIRLPRDVPHPIHGRRLMPLQSMSISDAIESVVAESHELHRFFANNPEARPVHPIFGPLDHAAWIRFHRKHTLHHLAQFGLRP